MQYALRTNPVPHAGWHRQTCGIPHKGNSQYLLGSTASWSYAQRQYYRFLPDLVRSALACQCQAVCIWATVQGSVFYHAERFFLRLFFPRSVFPENQDCNKKQLNSKDALRNSFMHRLKNNIGNIGKTSRTLKITETMSALICNLLVINSIGTNWSA